MWREPKERCKVDPGATPFFYLVGVCVLAGIVCYSIAAYVIFGLVHEVEQRGLRAVVERIWEGPKR